MLILNIYNFILVHAGGDFGFVPGALLVFKSKSKNEDYHGDMNSENFCTWITKQLIPNLPSESVVVVDNASYHNWLQDPPPSSKNRKAEIKKWLEDRVELNPDVNWTKRLLLQKLREIRPDHLQYGIDAIFKAHGHTVLRLPPYHPDLNPIEVVWGVTKRAIAAENTSQRVKDVEALIRKHFEGSHSQLWKGCCAKVVRNEQNYLATNLVIDFEVEITDNDFEINSTAEVTGESVTDLTFSTLDENDTSDSEYSSSTTESDETCTASEGENFCMQQCETQQLDSLDVEQMITAVKIVKSSSFSK